MGAGAGGGAPAESWWCIAAGVTHEQMVQVVKDSVIDGQVFDWVRQNIKKTQAEKDAHWQDVLSRPLAHDPAAVARLQKRKEESNLGHRTDLTNFVDYIDADEKRL